MGRLPGISGSEEETGEDGIEDDEDAGTELVLVSGVEEQVTDWLIM